MVSGPSLNRPSSPNRSASSWTTTTCARSRSSRPCRRTSPAQTRAGSGAWTRHVARRFGKRRERKVEAALAGLARALHERSARFVLIVAQTQRIATAVFLGECRIGEGNRPVGTPRYVWDYDIGDDEFQQILEGRLAIGRLDQDWAAARL